MRNKLVRLLLPDFVKSSTFNDPTSFIVHLPKLLRLHYNENIIIRGCFWAWKVIAFCKNGRIQGKKICKKSLSGVH